MSKSTEERKTMISPRLPGAETVQQPACHIVLERGCPMQAMERLAQHRLSGSKTWVGKTRSCLDSTAIPGSRAVWAERQGV